MSSEAVIVYTTCPSELEAVAMAKQLVMERHVACANLIPGLQSFYYWEGSLAQEQECLLMMKTLTSQLPELERRLTELHPYTVPAFLSIPTAYTSPPYLAWMMAQVDPAQRAQPERLV